MTSCSSLAAALVSRQNGVVPARMACWMVVDRCPSTSSWRGILQTEIQAQHRCHCTRRDHRLAVNLPDNKQGPTSLVAATFPRLASRPPDRRTAWAVGRGATVQAEADDFHSTVRADRCSLRCDLRAEVRSRKLITTPGLVVGQERVSVRPAGTARGETTAEVRAPGSSARRVLWQRSERSLHRWSGLGCEEVGPDAARARVTLTLQDRRRDGRADGAQLA